MTWLEVIIRFGLAAAVGGSTQLLWKFIRTPHFSVLEKMIPLLLLLCVWVAFISSIVYLRFSWAHI